MTETMTTFETTTTFETMTETKTKTTLAARAAYLFEKTVEKSSTCCWRQILTTAEIETQIRAAAHGYCGVEVTRNVWVFPDGSRLDAGLYGLSHAA